MWVKLDVFEYMKLIDSCWSDGTILSSTMLDKVMNEWYQLTTKQDRKQIYEYLNRTKTELSKRQMMVIARYNPDSQYMVYGKNQKAEAFLFQGEYYIDFMIKAEKSQIIEIEKL